MLLVDAYRAGFGGQDLESARRVLQALSSRAVDVAVEAFRRRLGPGTGNRACLASRMEDGEFLSQLPDGSLGRAFLAWQEERDLELAPATSMVSRGPVVPGSVAESYHLPLQLGSDQGTERHWVIRRWGVAHDLWHVLTGFDVDARGEAMLAAWSAGATPYDYGNLTFAVVAAVMRPLEAPSLLRSYLWGRHFRSVLVTAPWESWLGYTPERVWELLEGD